MYGRFCQQHHIDWGSNQRAIRLDIHRYRTGTGIQHISITTNTTKHRTIFKSFHTLGNTLPMELYCGDSTLPVPAATR